MRKLIAGSESVTCSVSQILAIFFRSENMIGYLRKSSIKFGLDTPNLLLEGNFSRREINKANKATLTKFSLHIRKFVQRYSAHRLARIPAILTIAIGMSKRPCCFWLNFHCAFAKSAIFLLPVLNVTRDLDSVRLISH